MTVSPNRWRHLEGAPLPSDIDIAWAAGLFDGEGSIGENHFDDRYGCKIILRVAMTHEAAIQRIASIFPYGSVRPRSARGVRLPYFAWCIANQGLVGYALIKMRPHLTVKAAESDLSLQYLGLYDPTREQSATFSRALRSHKTKGACHVRKVA
jgi:hypothetical protein